jgi:hypothetical protein
LGIRMETLDSPSSALGTKNNMKKSMGRLCSNSDERTKSKSKRIDGAECGSQNSKQQIVDDNNRRKQKNKANLARKKRKKNTIKLENEHLREKLASTEQERLGFSEQNNARGTE